MVSRIIPDDIDDPRERIARLDLGEKLRCTHSVYGGRLDKGRVKILKIERTMDVRGGPSSSTTLQPCEGGSGFHFRLPFS